MRYTKPPLPPEQQADLLLRRGMVGDRDRMIETLQSVSYYRLTGYWHPFRMSDDQFTPGTQFETVWNRYVFDRRLHLLVMDAVERIEVAVRTQLALHHSMLHGPFAYSDDPTSLSGSYPDWHVPVAIPNNRVFAVLSICRYCLGIIAPKSGWANRLHDLLKAYPDVPIKDMGFPPMDWKKSPLWK